MLWECVRIPLGRVSRGVRWRLGMQVAALELEAGTDQALAGFYEGRVTNCEFLLDPAHYEHPRAKWITDRVRGGRLLEVGCGNGGMTRLLAPQVDELVALDVSTPSLALVDALALPNVSVVQGLVEHFDPEMTFQWVVMSEVLEHLRHPGDTVARCMSWLAPGGSLLVTTPNGHWESNEHLQEFDFATFTALVAGCAAETVTVSYLRDREQRRRWLVAHATAPERPPAPDTFADRRAVAAVRRRNRSR
jgi:SAM-dependent methyltransferase